MPRRAAHWEQTVIVPLVRTAADQLVERGGEIEVERLGAARHAEPGGLPGEPERDRCTRRGRGSGDRESLVAALGILGTAGDLDDQ